MDHVVHVWRAVPLIAVLVLAGCQTRRPDFLARVREDCTAGDQWACDLLVSLGNPTPAKDTKPTEEVKLRR
jgi:hypothetical protein